MPLSFKKCPACDSEDVTLTIAAIYERALYIRIACRRCFSDTYYLLQASVHSFKVHDTPRRHLQTRHHRNQTEAQLIERIKSNTEKDKAP